MYDYSDIHRRLKPNFRYVKCDNRVRARAMTMLRVQTDSAWTGFEDQNGKNFQRLTNDFLLWSNKRRPHWSLNGLTPHERFYGRRLAKTA